MSKVEAGKEVAVAGAAGVPANYDYGDDAGAGFEGVKGSDLSIPFLAILQSNSPQVEDNSPEGAKAGLFFNTVTKELVDGEAGFNFLPVHREEAYVEWVPRTKGGGFVAIHATNSEVVTEAIQRAGTKFGKLQVGENDLVQTVYLYGLILEDDGKSTKGFAVISFKSTALRPERDMRTALYLIKGKPPLFANRARIKTVKQKNEKGTFYNFAIGPAIGSSWQDSLISPTEERALLDEARAFREMVTSGMARADFNSERVAGDTEVASDKPPF